jgi:uncharacterized protein YdaU (DUF1376 family)
MLSLEEEGAYIRLLCYCWLHGSIPADELQAIKLLGKGGSNVDISTVLAMFHPVHNSPLRLTHERLEAERLKQDAWRAKSAAGGRKSGLLRATQPVATKRKSKGSLQNGMNQKATLQSSSSIASSENTLRAAEPARPRERNEVLDSLVREAEQTDPLAATPALFAKAAKALKNIRAVTPDVTPVEIAARVKNYRSHFTDCTISATALSKHWGRCAQPNNENHRTTNGRQFANAQDYSGVVNKL